MYKYEIVFFRKQEDIIAKNRKEAEKLAWEKFHADRKKYKLTPEKMLTLSVEVIHDDN
jgi:hypothetical protein